MAKTKYTISVDEYICTDLARLRTMLKTHDFSGMLSTVERIQYHADRMEAALYEVRDRGFEITRLCKDEKLPEKELREKIIKLLKEKDT